MMSMNEDNDEGIICSSCKYRFDCESTLKNRNLCSERFKQCYVNEEVDTEKED